METLPLLMSVFLVCLGSSHPNPETVLVKEGDTAILGQPDTVLPSISNIYWFYHSNGRPTLIVNSVCFRGNISTFYYGEAKDRLQLDRHSGNLIIKSTKESNSGTYRMETEISTELDIELVIKLRVYVAVPMPVIYPKKKSSKTNCTVVCSVKNGREVMLSWSKGNVKFSNISSLNLSTNLSLPLYVGAEEKDWASYRCMASNLFSQSTTMLTYLCSSGSSNIGCFLSLFCCALLFFYMTLDAF
ncbi:uncharacterized protein LOC134095713 [Sardina pilchardus]|uniref:uncharacterized protein LOC134095713 n=1 Tax=Sardina pilchardus TaxID=27697 RepID=UPI002E0DC3E2